ncbi:MAG: hypothetical protein AAGD13_14845 [Pseudomonadota bacterium]
MVSLRHSILSILLFPRNLTPMRFTGSEHPEHATGEDQKQTHAGHDSCGR